MWLTFFFLLDSALTEEETEGQRGKMTCGRLQSNAEPQRQSSNQVSRLASRANAPIPTHSFTAERIFQNRYTGCFKCGVAAKHWRKNTE